MSARVIPLVAAAVIAALTALPAGCKDGAPKPPPGPGSGSEVPATPDASASPPPGSTCTAETLTRVSQILTAAHPCRARVEAAAGRMVRIGPRASGTIVSTAPVRGAGLLATCQGCGVPADALLLDPEREPPVAFLIGAPARLAGGAAGDGLKRYAAHRLFGPVAPATSAAVPADDFTLSAVSGEPVDDGAPLAKAVSNQKLALDDPRGLAASKAPFFDVRAGAPALVLGYAASVEGELVASVGAVLDDDAARAAIARDAAEAGVPYDAQAEVVIAARAAPGMIGGGVFDEGGRFVGIVARAAGKPDGSGAFVRAVRATYVAAKLSGALSAAPVALRTKVLPFLP